MIEFLAANWIWIAAVVLLVVMHRSGHGCGMHGGHQHGGHDQHDHHQHERSDRDDHAQRHDEDGRDVNVPRPTERSR